MKTITLRIGVLLLAAHATLSLRPQTSLGAGVEAWVQRYHGLGNGGDYANAVAVGGGGNVYVTGASAGSDGSFDYATVAYSSGGVPLWTNVYIGPANSADVAEAVAVGGNGNVYVTGYSYGTNGSYDYATLGYSSTGVTL